MTDKPMQGYAADENYFSEDGLEESTEKLMRKLKLAKDPEAYREHFHNRGASPAESNTPSVESEPSSSAPAAKTQLFSSVDVLAALLGLVVGALIYLWVLA